MTSTSTGAAQGALAPEQGDSTVTLDGVSLYYGEYRAVKNINLKLPAHAITAIIGPSGCGKSTVLRSINRINDKVPIFRVDGKIRVGSMDIYAPTTDPVMLRQQVGMVFQRPNPFPMSIYDNVAFGVRLFDKLPKKELDEIVEWALDEAGLWEEVKDKLGQSGQGLSGGQQQRLCIARSIATYPEVLLMDEPCSALDPISTRVVEETILEIGRDITIVIVTHNMQQAARVSDLCAFFLVEEFGKPGRIIESGDTKKLFEAPDDPRTLDYVTGRFG
ncbi:MAG: phosphate ABC transporter ATP-binding protein [Actinobacteria bacterium]|nr:phosphate ABC transporter ATP-binding protein [Actinomycetota bacterium]